MSVYLDRFLNVPATRLPKAAGRRPRRAARGAARPARPPAAGRRGRPARRVVPRRGRRPGPARRRARRVPAARGPELPHDPVRRGGRTPARAAARHGRVGTAAASQPRATWPRTRRPRARSARRSRSRGACTAASGSTRTRTFRPRPDRRMIAGCASFPAARSPSSSPTSRARRSCSTSSATSYAEALSEHRRVLRAAFDAHGGVEVDTQGDAFFVAFSRARTLWRPRVKASRRSGTGRSACAWACTRASRW